MRILIAEDDPASRRLLQILLSPYGPCDLANDGQEAINAYTAAIKSKSPYNLICLDIMMPGLSGRDALRSIREIEEAHGVTGLARVKIMMTTALSDRENVFGSFREECDSYLVKPIDKKKLIAQLEQLGFSPVRKDAPAGV